MTRLVSSINIGSQALGWKHALFGKVALGVSLNRGEDIDGGKEAKGRGLERHSGKSYLRSG